MAKRMESQATFLNDQDTLCVLLTESGVGIKEVAYNDACTHASADDNDVVCLGGCLSGVSWNHCASNVFSESRTARGKSSKTQC